MKSQFNNYILYIFVIVSHVWLLFSLTNIGIIKHLLFSEDTVHPMNYAVFTRLAIKIAVHKIDI